MDPLRRPRRRPGPALIARLRRLLKPPRVLRPTRAGWLFFVIVFGVGFAALNTGNNLLYLVLSLLLAFLALSGVLSETALRGITVRRRLPRELHAGGRNLVQLEITNGQRRVPALAIVVRDRLRRAPDGLEVVDRGEVDASGDASRRRRRRERRRRHEVAGRCFALRVGAGETERRRYAFTPARRGPVTFRGFEVSTRFPFGLFLKSREIDAEDRALVYPRIDAASRAARVVRSDATGDAAWASPGHGETVSGLREFAEGDRPRHVHWPSSLRRNALLVSETEDEREAEVEVELAEVAGTDDDARDRFERSVSSAASEIVRHLERGLAVALRTHATRLPAGVGARQRTRLLSFLSTVDRDGRAAEVEP